MTRLLEQDAVAQVMPEGEEPTVPCPVTATLSAYSGVEEDAARRRSPSSVSDVEVAPPPPPPPHAETATAVISVRNQADTFEFILTPILNRSRT